MSLTPGTRLGPYEISAALGAGGMGDSLQHTRMTHAERFKHSRRQQFSVFQFLPAFASICVRLPIFPARCHSTCHSTRQPWEAAASSTCESRLVESLTRHSRIDQPFAMRLVDFLARRELLA